MTIRWPAGRPGDHAGISHLIKHYLNPGEGWEDVVSALDDRTGRPVDIPAEYRPHALWNEIRPDRLGISDTRDVGLLPPDVERRWPRWVDAHRMGYAATVSHIANASRPPLVEGSGLQGAAGPVDQSARTGTPVHVGLGVIRVLRRVPDGSEAYVCTAFRPQIAPRGLYDARTADHSRRDQRMSIAELKANALTHAAKGASVDVGRETR